MVQKTSTVESGLEKKLKKREDKVVKKLFPNPYLVMLAKLTIDRVNHLPVETQIQCQNVCKVSDSTEFDDLDN